MSTFCVTTFYEVYRIVDGMACGMVSTESKLGLRYYVLRCSKVVNSFISDFFKDFTKNRQCRDWPIVFYFVFSSLFMDWGDYTIL